MGCEDVLTERACKKCDATKPLTAFPKNKRSAGGRTHECNECTYVRARAWRHKASSDPEFRRRRRLSQEKVRAARVGLTLPELLAAQERAGFKCEICCRTPEGHGADGTLHADHCHATGKFRGFLCSDCNRAIGLFRDTPELLTKAADYLNERGGRC